MSQLPNLLSLASLLFMLSLAYLKLERFQHWNRISRYAKERLNALEHTLIKPYFTNTNSYVRLEALAAPEHNLGALPSRHRIYRFLFLSGLDRFLSGLSLIVSLGVIVLGSLHSFEIQFLARFFVQDYIIWSWAVLIAFILFSTFSALYGERFVNNAHRIIDEYSRELDEIISGVEALDASLKRERTALFGDLDDYQIQRDS